jgi:hypothetical protein
MAADTKTDEATRAETEKRWINAFKPNCISSWYPILVELGIKTPRTIIVELDEDLTKWAYAETIPRLQEYIDRVQQATDEIGYPCFLRSGQTSHKHSWKRSCYVENSKTIGPQMFEIGYLCAMADWPIVCFAARELIPTSPIFTAFYGDMPVTREFRLFVNEGEIIHIQPYWPPAAIEGHTKEENWPEKLAAINEMTDEEKTYLSELTEKIGKKMGGYWSVDWLQSADGEWYCIDMAWGGNSYKWDPETGKELDPAI